MTLSAGWYNSPVRARTPRSHFFRVAREGLAPSWLLRALDSSGEVVMILRRGLLTAAGVAAAVAAMPAPASAQGGGSRLGGRGMNITRSGTQPSQKGSAEYFTGSVRI